MREFIGVLILIKTFETEFRERCYAIASSRRASIVVQRNNRTKEPQTWTNPD